MTAAEYKRSICRHLLHAYMLKEEQIDIYLPRFLDSLQTYLEKLQQPLQTGNFRELRKVAHTLKGALLNLGLHELADIAYTMEKAAGTEDTTQNFQAMYRQLHNEISSFTGADPANPAADTASPNRHP